MKLRVRSLESKETLKIEVPDSCSLQQLKETLSRAISSPSYSLHLSLNRKDEIIASTPNDSLHSIGIASGDLVFYTVNSSAFASETPLAHKHEPSQTEHTDHIMQETPNQRSSSGQMEVGETDVMTDDIAESEQPGILASMEIIDGSDEVTGKSDSEPSFVKRVLRETLSDDFNDVKLLFVAVHAIILESGFVLLDKVSGMAVGCSNILDYWPSATSTLSLWKMVKDGLALPLLIDICEKVGLGSPPCFMLLPTEIKLKVLEYLHGVDIAKLACTWSEMRYLSSNNDLWKQKFEELVGQKKPESEITSYKAWYANKWVGMQHHKRNLDGEFIMRNGDPTYYKWVGMSSIVGGDYDRFPGLRGFGVPSPFGQPGLPHRTFQQRRGIYPLCSLRERNV